MKQFLVSINIFAMVLLCSEVFSQPVFQPSKTIKYNMQIDARNKQLSGMLIVREVDNGTRIVGISYMGPTIFDYTITPDSLIVNSSFAPLKRKSVEQLLSRDLSVVFIDENLAKLKKEHSGQRVRKCGHCVSKSLFYISYNDGINNQVLIKHPFIKLSFTIEPIK